MFDQKASAFRPTVSSHSTQCHSFHSKMNSEVYGPMATNELAEDVRELTEAVLKENQRLKNMLTIVLTNGKFRKGVLLEALTGLKMEVAKNNQERSLHKEHTIKTAYQKVRSLRKPLSALKLRS